MSAFQEKPPTRMYYFRYHVKPTTHHPNASTLGGATANVFVNMVDPTGAEGRARDYLISQSWTLVSLDQTGEVREEKDFCDDELLVKFYRQAMEYGVSCFMVAYPIGGDDLGERDMSARGADEQSPDDSILVSVSKGNLTEDELNRRANLIIDKFAGIFSPFEAFYIRSILYSASCARNAFEEFVGADKVLSRIRSA